METVGKATLEKNNIFSTPYEKKFGKVEPVDKKEHKRGWWRSAYYWLGWEYESKNDYPKEEDVNRKQVLMKQVTLSKLKMKKVRIDPKIPFDLQKIKSSDKKVPNILKDSIEKPVALERQITVDKCANIKERLKNDSFSTNKTDKKKTVSFVKELKNVEGDKNDNYIICPPNSPNNHLSQKQKHHKNKYIHYKRGTRYSNIKNLP